MCLSSSIRPSSRWYSSIRMLPNLSVPKFVAPPRSVVNAIVLPSGDHEGSRSAYLSLVRRRRSEPSAFTMNRSDRSEEHTSELQSRLHLVCRLLLEKKKKETAAWTA